MDRLNELLPEEAQQIVTSSTSRQREFSSGRWCARRAMRSHGLPDFPILSGPAREPRWPAGVIGTISHSSKWSISAIASGDKIAGLGVDVESLEQTSPLPQEMLFTQREQDWLLSQPEDDQHRLQLLLFSAKESFYKAIFPIIGEYIDYLSAEVEIDSGTRSFQITSDLAVLKSQLGQFHCQGRYLYCDGHVWTGVALTNR